MKIKGHTTIILKDVKTGKVERHEDNNMMTKALEKYFQNAGFMNYPNLDRTTLVETLLGGILAFDDEIPENANTIYTPAGLKMIANGAVGTVNNSAVLEMGSYSTTESGWQDDGSYVQTYDYTTSQANGTIACVCLTSKMYGYMGEGNTISNTRHTNKIDSRVIPGSATSYGGIPGYIFNIDFSDSSCYSFNVEEVVEDEQTVRKGFVRKYRLPITKINLKQTPSSPIMLSETMISLSETYLASTVLAVPFGSNLLLFNVNMGSSTWGNGFTQYLWTLTPSAQMSVQTVVNTTGDSGLVGLGPAYFDGNYCFFPKTLFKTSGGGTLQSYFTSKTIYVWNRSTGTMNAIQNDAGYNDLMMSRPNYYQYVYNIGWDLMRGGTNNGRIITLGGGEYYGFVVDGVLEKAWVHNAQGIGYGVVHSESGLFKRLRGSMIIYRDPTYIASINNLDTPVVKTAEKTMKIIYRLTFEEEENE